MCLKISSLYITRSKHVCARSHRLGLQDSPGRIRNQASVHYSKNEVSYTSSSLSVDQTTRLTEAMLVGQHLSAGRPDQPRGRLQHIFRRRRAVLIYAPQSLQDRELGERRKRDLRSEPFPTDSG